MRSLSNNPLFNFCRFRVDKPTGGLEVRCVLIFVGKKNIINKIPDLTNKNEAETTRKLDVNVLFC